MTRGDAGTRARRSAAWRGHFLPAFACLATLLAAPAAALAQEPPAVPTPAATDVAAPAAAPAWHAAPDEELRALLEDLLARGASTGLVLGVIEGGVPRVVAAGKSAGADSAALDGTSLFEIGSVSKALTTTLLAEMVGRGEVSLQDPVQKLLPESVRVPSLNGRAITLLDLATASSGLPRLPPLAPADPLNPYADFTVDDLYKFLSSYTLTREPGAAYEYSNLGMGLLGHALALRAGKSYEALVTERVLAPLGMTDTHIALTPELRARLAAGHGADLEPAANWDLPTLAGAGAWRSTARDMQKLLAACLAAPEGPLGDALRLAIAPQRPTGSPGLSIGLGWHILERGETRLVWHNGETGGYHAFIGFAPATGANVVVLSNCARDIDDLGLHVLDPGIPLRPLPPRRAEVPVSAEVLEKCVGLYELSPTFSIEITRQGDALYSQATNQSRFRLHAASPTRFFLTVVDAEIEFTADASGAVTGLVLHQNGRDSPGKRVR